MVGSAGQVIPGNAIVNSPTTGIYKLNSATQGGTANYSSTGPITVTSSIFINTGIFTLGGPLTVRGGTMTLVGSTPGSIVAGSNQVTFNASSAQTVPLNFFSGNTISNLNVKTISGTVGGTNFAGPLTVNSSLTVASFFVPVTTATAPVNLTGTGVNGVLNITGSSFAITAFNGTPVVGTQYTIASAPTITGTFSGLTLPTGYTGNLTYNTSATPNTVTLSVTPSSDATLSGLVLSAGTLTPAFASGTTSYTASVANGTSSITITPTANISVAAIKVNGTIVASGAASAPIALNVGSNTITTLVTAQDGSTTKTYTVNVTRAALSTDAALSGLTLSTGTLTPVFAGATTNYTASVNNATSSVTIIPTTNDATATVTVNGTPVVSGSASAAIPLNVGSNSITTIVTAQDGTTTQTYTVNVTRAPVSTDATLSGLTLSAGTLAPVFASATTSYTASVGNTINSITVTPTTNDVNATVTVNGTVVASGTASTTIPLNVGANTVTVTGTAQDGTTTQTYTLTVTRAASSNADLSNFAISNGVLSPVFSAGTINYTTSVAGITSITVTPTVADNTATVTVNGITVASGSPSGAIAINAGPNTITTIVTAQDGSQKTYALIVTKTLSASTNANLSALALSTGTLSPAFASTTTNYTASVSNATTSVTITPTVADVTATVKVNGTTVSSSLASGNIALNVGANSITVIVTAQDGSTTNTYTVVVTRAPSANATLGGISLATGTLSPVFSAGNLSYTASVPNATTAITLTPTTADANATVKVNGTTVSSGSASGSITLSVGANTITTVVTAQDGATKITYVVIVTRLPSSNANLAAITLSSGTLSPAFASAINSYTASVLSGISSVTVTPTLSDATASIKVNGTTVTSGNVSTAQALTVGSNSINIVVTAQDGTTINTYTINVNRPGTLQTITFAALKSVSYGSADFAPGASSTNNTIPITYTSNNTNVATITGAGNIHIVGAGSATITAVQSGNSVYSPATSVPQTLVVIPAVLTTTANNQSKVYGAALPTLTVSYTGFVNGDTQSIITTQANTSTTATTTSVAGTYPITVSGAVVGNNYTINYVPGVLTVAPATRVFAYVNVAAHTYGDADFSPGATVNTGETITYTSSDITVATILNGLVHIVSGGQVTITASIASNPNYADVTPIAQTLVIGRATQTVTFSSLPILQVGSADYLANATASSGLPVTLSSSDQSIATANGLNIIAVGIGITTITATQPGDKNFLPATASQTVKTEDEVALVKVRPGLSPNGDGIDDHLTIDGIEDYPSNTLLIVNKSGSKVFQASGYNNTNNVFDGHSSTNGDLLPPGTYYYELTIQTKGENKRKAGYIILKFN